MPRTVLIIDDSVEELRALVSMLKCAGYRLILSSNGPDGLQRAALFHPDLILLDVRMPNMDGFAVCRRLKMDPQTHRIPVLFLTAANELNQRLEGLRIGACDYVVKPPLEEEVLLRIGVHMRMLDHDAVVEAQKGYASAKSGAPQLPEAASHGVKLVCELVAQAPGKPWTLDYLAAQSGTHRKRLSAEFKLAFGTTVMAWVREHRMQQGSAWLRNTSLSVHAIAQDLGFESAANFATAFRERFGVPPSEYRQILDDSPIP